MHHASKLSRWTRLAAFIFLLYSSGHSSLRQGTNFGKTIHARIPDSPVYHQFCHHEREAPVVYDINGSSQSSKPGISLEPNCEHLALTELLAEKLSRQA